MYDLLLSIATGLAGLGLTMAAMHQLKWLIPRLLVRPECLKALTWVAVGKELLVKLTFVVAVILCAGCLTLSVQLNLVIGLLAIAGVITLVYRWYHRAGNQVIAAARK